MNSRWRPDAFPRSKTVTVSVAWENNGRKSSHYCDAIIIPSLRGLGNDVIPQAKFRGFYQYEYLCEGEGLKGGHCSLILDGVRGAFFSSCSLLLEFEGSTELCFVASRIRVNLSVDVLFLETRFRGRKDFIFEEKVSYITLCLRQPNEPQSRTV